MKINYTFINHNVQGGSGNGSSEADSLCSFSVWENDCDDLGINAFSIGIVKRSNEAKNDFLIFSRKLSNINFNFLLLMDSGKILSSKIKEDIYLAQDVAVIFNDSSIPNQDNINLSIDKFMKDKNLKIESGYFYQDKDYDDKVKKILPTIEVVSEEIDRKLYLDILKDPHLLNTMHWRDFERLLADIFNKLGYSVKLGPGRSDGGIDIELITSSNVSDLLILVQAKRYKQTRKIGLTPIQALYGVVESRNANQGLFITTSYYLPGVNDYIVNNSLNHRLEAKNRDDIVGWINLCIEK